MIERVLRLADKPVRAIMTPRTELAWIDRTDPPKEIAAALKSAPHSRFVVCDGSVDNVVGVVQAKDILDRILSGGELSVARRAAPADRGARHGDRAGCAGAAEIRSARARAGDGRIRQLRGRGDRGRRAGGDRRRSRPTPRPSPGGEDGDGEAALVMDGLMPVDELKVAPGAAGPAGRGQLSYAGRTAAGAAAAGAARRATASCSPAGGSRCWRWTAGGWTRCGRRGNRSPKPEQDRPRGIPAGRAGGCDLAAFRVLRPI